MTCISERQRRFHIATEAASVLSLPFYLKVASMKAAPPWVRVAAGVMAFGVAVVDGGLLFRWADLARRRRQP
ncbi:MAG: hypothetical protein ABIE42_09150 [Candidatus Eisenbacteria bacterium]